MKLSSREEKKYWVGVSGFVGLGPKRFRLLRDYFGSARQIWEAGADKWRAVGVKRQMVELWDQWRRERDLDEEMERLERELIKVITIEDENYPKLLKEIDSPPFIIYVKGAEKALSQPCLAVVGSRRVTEYGRQAGQRLVKDLTLHGLVIVSGLARGVDSLAHRVCLENKGLTVAVLGHGLDRIYPPENRLLAEQIVASGGALVSEYPLGYQISRGNFPARNRIVAGLSLGVVVIEGKHKSGTKITAGWAAEYGREVFAVPGPIDSVQSEATADLIKQGAKLVTSVEDILEELG
jgi:DNA processing protein